MIQKKLKQRLADGERVNVFALCRAFHPNVVEMFAIQGGYQGFWIDHEHGGFTTREMELACMAGRACGLDSFVRIPPLDYSLVTRCLESGASGVMVAQINSPQQAEQYVQFGRFAAQGSRGMNPSGYDGKFGMLPLAEFANSSNANVFMAMQIETVAAVECCEEIASIDGVDLLFIGPVDLSQALGVTGQLMHPKCLEAVARVARACERHEKPFGAVTTTPEHARMLLNHGCRMFTPANDVRTFQAGIEAVKQRFAELF